MRKGAFYIIGGRAEDLLVDSYYTAQTRKVDEFNKYKDFVVESIQAISFMVSLANPGTYVAVGFDLLAGGASIADGGIRLAQGDLEGGTQELAMSVPFFLLSCKDLKPLSTQKVQYAHVDELAEDLKFSINEEALDNFVDYKNYQEYWDKLESGQYIHSGMSDEEYAKWMYSDSKVGDYLTIEKVNYDDILSLRKSERMSQTIDNAASVEKIIVSETSYGKSSGILTYQSGKTTKGYSDFADGMSPEDAARYIAKNEKAFFNEFSERARAAGLNSAHIEEAFTAMRTGDYAKMASYFDTSSPVNGAVFWSGNKEGAAAYANSIGGTIMEQTPGGQVFDNWRGLQGMYPEWDTVTDLNQKPIWDALSSQYANGAEGMATYVHPSGYEGKVWLNIEKPILEEKDIIIQEVIIDAK